MTDERSSFPLIPVIVFCVAAVIVGSVRHWPFGDEPRYEESVFQVDKDSRLSMTYVTERDGSVLKMALFENDAARWEQSFPGAVSGESLGRQFYAQSASSKIFLKDRVILPLTKQASSDGGVVTLSQELVAVQLRDGKILWKTPIPTSVSQPWFYSRMVNEQLIVSTTPVWGPSKLHSISVKDGGVKWSVNSIAAPAGVQFHEQWMVALELSTRRTAIIDLETGDHHYVPVASIGGIADGALYFVMPQTGEGDRWQLGMYSFQHKQTRGLFELPGLRKYTLGWGVTHFILYENLVIYKYTDAADSDAQTHGLVAVNRTSGEQVWKRAYSAGWETVAESGNCGRSRFWDAPPGYSHGYCMDLLLRRPERTIFSKLESPFVPIHMNDNLTTLTMRNYRYDIVDLRDGQLVESLKMPDAASSVGRFGDQYVVAASVNDEAREISFLLMDGKSGRVRGGLQKNEYGSHLGQSADPFFLLNQFFDETDWDTDPAVIEQHRKQLSHTR